MHIRRSNTILYCANWRDVVVFYREVIGLVSSFENDWFVEFDVSDGAHISIADARRATIDPSDGAGITLSWRVDDLDAACARLTSHRLDVPTPIDRWGARAVFVRDPAGNRIELWEDGEVNQGSERPRSDTAHRGATRS